LTHARAPHAVTSRRKRKKAPAPTCVKIPLEPRGGCADDSPADRPSGVDRIHHAHRARARARDRQRDLHLDPGRSPAGQAARAGPPHRPVWRHVHAHRAAAGAGLDHRPHRAAVQRVRRGDLGPRPDPDRRWTVPAVEKHQGDPPAARRRGGRRGGVSRARGVRRHDCSDHADRPRVLARFDHHRGRDGERPPGHDRRGSR